MVTDRHLSLGGAIPAYMTGWCQRATMGVALAAESHLTDQDHCWNPNPFPMSCQKSNTTSRNVVP